VSEALAWGMCCSPLLRGFVISDAAVTGGSIVRHHTEVRTAAAKPAWESALEVIVQSDYAQYRAWRDLDVVPAAAFRTTAAADPLRGCVGSAGTMQRWNNATLEQCDAHRCAYARASQRWPKASMGLQRITLRAAPGAAARIRLEYEAATGNARRRLLWDAGIRDTPPAQIASI